MRKLLVRLRQLARNTHNYSSYDTILNPQNTAALFKIAEGTRVRPAVDAATSQVTRDALVAAWADCRGAEFHDWQKRMDHWAAAQARGDLPEDDPGRPPDVAPPPER